MRVLRGSRPLPDDLRGGAVAIGNFDGVHRGHRALIARAHEAATAHGGPLLVLTFEPHPREVITPERAPARLSPLRRKLELLAGMGVDAVVVLAFNETLMRMPAEDFIKTVLNEAMAAAVVVTGENFRFGHKRAGDTDLLARMAAPHGFTFLAVPGVEVAGELCSSTRIRDAIAQGEVATARHLLDSDHEVIGIVRPGDRRGRTLGFPTANLHPLHRLAALPAFGIYAVEAAPLGEDKRPAVASLGVNPTFGGDETRLEVHFLDGPVPELYGRRLRVAFIERLRAERRFDDVSALIAQMETDCAEARAIHAGRRASP